MWEENLQVYSALELIQFYLATQLSSVIRGKIFLANKRATKMIATDWDERLYLYDW